MLLWVTFALLAAAVATLLIRTPSTGRAAHGADPDLAVYRDQLAELDADVDRGVVQAADASAARTEIARRLLRHGDASAAGRSRSPAVAHAAAADRRSERVLIVAAAAVPLLALAGYIALGSPGLPGRPLAERLAAAPDQAPVNDLIAKVKARLRDKPDDGMGWAVIAPVYMSQGRFAEAGQAYERALGLLGETPERLLGLGRALVMANNGVVVDPAKRVYQRLLALDPRQPEATFWLAIHDEQNGRLTAAQATYGRMLAEGPADAPWRPAVESRLAGIAASAGGGAPSPPSGPPAAASGGPSSPPAPAASRPVAAAPAPGPASSGGGMSAPVLASPVGPKPAGAGPTPAEFVAAAQGLDPAMRSQMIGRMIDRARAAVTADPKDGPAWSRLVTGHKALGQSAEATAALKEARAALAGQAVAVTELDALASSLGLPPS